MDTNPANQVKIRDEEGRFVPGVSGNPAGRPKKGQALTDLMGQMMEDQPDIKKAIIARLLKGAADGDIAFIREVLDRLEGKATQKTELSGQDGQPILISASRGFIPPGTPVIAPPEGSNAGKPGTVQDDRVA